MNSLISRLEHLKASEALKHDGEFVAVVYFQLPDRHKQEWLKFNKDSLTDKWSSMINFLQESYDKALQDKLLLSRLCSKDSTIGANAGVAAAVIDRNVEPCNTDVLNRESDRKKKYDEHTF